jgi:hypothetical protein
LSKLWSLLAVGIAIFVACGNSDAPSQVLESPANGPDAQIRGPETTADGVTAQAGAESAGETEGEAIATRGSSPAAPAVNEPRRETIVVDISLYVVVDDLESPSPAISSHRSEDDLREILDGMNEIWQQAGIRFDARFVGTLEVPAAILRRVVRGELQTFFTEIGDGFVVPQPSTINGFYVREVGGVNGINPSRSRTYFVVDQPSVHDRRVSSHEIGHVFGLHHVLSDSDRLLFSGTNGMTLTEDEATVGRYVAQGILDGAR